MCAYIFTFLFFYFPFKSISQEISRIESLQSLYVEVYKDNQKLGSATGFIIRSKTQNYLVTNYHVLTLKNPFTNQFIDTIRKISPNKIKIMQHGKVLGKYQITIEPLFDEKGNRLWHENKFNNNTIDVVELPLKDTNNIIIYPVSYKSIYDSDLILRPTDRVFILGFPLSLHSEPFLPIWKSGLLASEPDINQDGLPITFVDEITYDGMSGSPVYYISDKIISHGNLMEFSDLVSIFVGVFSAQQIDNVFGILWKGKFLQAIFDKLP